MSRHTLADLEAAYRVQQEVRLQRGGWRWVPVWLRRVILQRRLQQGHRLLAGRFGRPPADDPAD